MNPILMRGKTKMIGMRSIPKQKNRSRIYLVLVTCILMFMASSGLKPSQALGDVILDNGDPGTSSVGLWQVSGGTSAYPLPTGNSLWSRNGATYTWQVNSATPGYTPGYYEVYMWHSGYASRATNIRVDIALTLLKKPQQIPDKRRLSVKAKVF